MIVKTDHTMYTGSMKYGRADQRLGMRRRHPGLSLHTSDKLVLTNIIINITIIIIIIIIIIIRHKD